MREFILGSDWWSDCDDAVAIRLMTNLHKKGELRLLGISIDAGMDCSVRSLDAFNYDNGVDIPIGVDRQATDFVGEPSYQYRLATMPHRRDDATAEDAVKLYRRLLASAEGQVELVEIGFSQVLVALLDSSADELSPLNGRELVRQKVRELWIMAGKWDGQGEQEHNFCNNARASVAASRLCAEWPSPITFLGYEIGYTVFTGSKLKEGDTLKQVLIDHNNETCRESWDPMTILLAYLGSPAAAGYDEVRGYAKVKAEDGSNYFTPDANGPHRYVIKQHPDQYYVDAIDALIDKF